MGIEVETLYDKSQTASQIKKMISLYSSDLRKIKMQKNGKLVALADLSLLEYFDFIKNLPYRRDEKPVEIVARPAILLTSSQFTSGNDCKKKSVLIGSWLKENGIQYRLIGSSSKRDKKIHHVFPQALLSVNGEKQWLNIDATYKHFKPFQRKIVTKSEVL